jgi:iron complex outermembrane receptor protein
MDIMKRNRVAALLLLGLGCTTAEAQVEEDFALLYGDEEMISIATGTQKPLHLAPAVASVVTASDIKAMGATTLDEALELIPGLHVSASSLNRLNSVYSIRGIHTGQNAQVLLTIDGIPLKDTYTGSRMNTFRLPVANISRIEVIRGPGSAVHGADAFAGVINVVTKDARELNGVAAGVRAGSFDSQESWAQYGGRVNDWGVSFSLEHAISDGDQGRKVDSDLATVLGAPSFAPAVPLQSRYNILNTRLGIANDNWDISLWSWLQRDGGTGAGAAQAIDPVGGTETDYLQLDVNYRFPEKLNGWEIGSRLNVQYEDENNRFQLLPPGSVVPVGDDGNIGTTPNSSCPVVAGLGQACLVSFTDGLHGNPGEQFNNSSIELNALYKEHRAHLVRLGLGLSQQRLSASETKNFGPGTPAVLVGETAPDPVFDIWFISGALTDLTGTTNIFVPDQRRDAWYLAVQDEWQFAPDWEFTGGLRYDHYSDFGGTVNPRLAVVWAMDYNLTSKLLLASAFRAPSFGEMFSQNNPVLLGNAQLRPETINTAELAFDYRPNFDWQEMFNLFYYEARDLIDYAPVAGGNQAQNLNSQKGYGVEMESIWKPSNQLQLSMGFA